jgi:hypothetical protein
MLGRSAQKMYSRVSTAFRKLAVPRKWRWILVLSIAASTIAAVAFDMLHTVRYYSHNSEAVTVADYRHAVWLSILGASISIVSYGTPRLITLVVPTVLFSFIVNTLSGFYLTTLPHLNRPEPHFPLDDFPWSFGRFIPFVLLCWTLGITFLVWSIPRLWCRWRHAVTRGGGK